MSIHIYNSLTRKKEEFIPLVPQQANVYTCGVTVYDDSHIGHARSLYVFDLMRRYLKYRGFNVKFVRNITDIDDKIIKRSNELKTDWRELVEKYIAGYRRDLRDLGIEEADFEPRATENIPDMVRYISFLIEKGYAYEAGGDVYFDVRKFPSYGKLSGQGIDDMRSGARIEPSGLKRDVLDFALWKKSKEGEPSWDSPWGSGRPGWHIECSVMAQKFLKTPTLDIHAGGRDLVFPHHENEIAQAEAATGEPFARYWIHHGLLTINGQKMSKSLGNFVTIKEALKKYHPDALKIFFLQAHYSSPVDFTETRMEESCKALQRFEILFHRAQQIQKANLTAIGKTADFIEEHKNNFIAAMDDDFNTPVAIANLFELLNATNKYIDAGKDDNDYAQIVNFAINTITELSKNIFNLSFQVVIQLTKEEEELINRRRDARVRKDFNESDLLREELKKSGIIVEDTKDGQVWRRV